MTVKPSVEEVATCIAFASGPMGTHYYDYALKAAQAVLALIGGLTEAEVKAEALEEAADEADRLYAGSDGSEVERAWIAGVRAAVRVVRARAAAIRDEQP